MLRDDKTATINGLRSPISYSQLSDKQIGDQVRMLLRTDLKHEPVCCAARDRIYYLSELVAEARDMLAQAPGWPPSQPMHTAPRDGTHVLLKGPDGTKAVCRWLSTARSNNPVVLAQGGDAVGYWCYLGSALAFHNPGRWWPLPGDEP